MLGVAENTTGDGECDGECGGRQPATQLGARQCRSVKPHHRCLEQQPPYLHVPLPPAGLRSQR